MCKLFSILFGIFLSAAYFTLPAQIKVNDTLEMPEPGTFGIDSTLSFEFDSSSDTLEHPMTIGLVLSGGGAKGLAHIGVMKVLEREGIHVDYIGGTSMGGLVGGLRAAGYTPEQLEVLTNNLPWEKLLTDEKERRDLPLQEKVSFDKYIISLPMEGLIPGLPKGLKEGQLIMNILNRLTWKVNDIHNFENLPIPYFCVATNLETGDTVLIRSGDLPIAMRATMSIPSILAPVEVDGKTLVDGGVVNNFPVDIMMSLGMDYVIGVDVGAPLYKADQISSVIDILDQISSFHQQQRHKDNVMLTDLYIKPDISGISVMSFDDVQSIIDRGEKAAMEHIDEIRELAAMIKNQKRPPRKFYLRMDDTIFIEDIEVKGLEKVNMKLVKGRLALNIPGVNTVDHINAAIDRLYSSDYFDFINYKLIKKRDGYLLSIEVRENKTNRFNVGARYDTDLGASVLLNVELRNVLLSGSRLDFNIRVGSNPGGGIVYLVERGRRPGFGISFHYDSRNIKTYTDDFKTTVGSYYMSFTTMDVVAFTNQTNNATFILGGQLDYLSITSEVSQIPVDYKGDPYFNIYMNYIIDSYDDRYFPKKGGYFRLLSKYITQKNLKSVFYTNLELSSVVNISNRIALLPSLFIGASWGGLSNTGYLYMLGGAGYNEFKNMRPFAGLPFSGIFSENLLTGSMDIRYNFYKKHFIILRGNLATYSNFPEELLTNSTLIYGTGLAYGFKSIIGPIQLGMNLSNKYTQPSVFLNIGYYF